MWPTSLIAKSTMAPDRVTVGAIAIVAYCLANVIHEGIGHGGACLASAHVFTARLNPAGVQEFVVRLTGECTTGSRLPENNCQFCPVDKLPVFRRPPRTTPLGRIAS